jgi:predicted nucleic acid-binding protein
MTGVFADSGYWIALLNVSDNLNPKAREVSMTLTGRRIVTTEMVIAEVMNGLSRHVYGGGRSQIAQAVREIRINPQVDVVAQTSAQLWAAVDYFGSIRDKEWGLTDCVSFQVMRERGIAEALAHDHHFEQAGFTALLR